MTQSAENHTKLVPVFHFFVMPVFAINLGWSIYRVSRFFSFGTVMLLLLAAAFVLAALYGRMFALTVQDRVIRLEMRLRLRDVLPPDLRARIMEFNVSQLVAMRFASDAELPELARKVLDEHLIDRKAIKKLVKNWQPDLLRA
ncbi:MAG TPA: DUF6526 family protein [Candidatus Acidoferrales bacterium]|nr:DUF6526 family protein [Candidatus Acidoferrales bacterium]